MVERILSPDELEVLEEVGRGGFGIVYRGLVKGTKQEVAIKQIDLENDQADIFEINKEIQIISQCRLSQITQYYGCFVKGYKLWVIMEYVDGGSLFEILKSGSIRDERIIQLLVKDILEALVYLHGQGKIHRDLKSQNILLNRRGEVKITDFGVSTQLSSNFSYRKTTVGTPYWMAPEVILNHSGGYGYVADIWSLGCCVYEMVMCKPPLQNRFSPMEALRQISNCRDNEYFSELIELQELNISETVKDFMRLCFQVNPSQRPSARKLLKHKLFTENNGNLSDRISSVKHLLKQKNMWERKNYEIREYNYYVSDDEPSQKLLDRQDLPNDMKKVNFDMSLIRVTSQGKHPPNNHSELRDTNGLRTADNITDEGLTSEKVLRSYTDLGIAKTFLPEFERILRKISSKLETKYSLTGAQSDLLASLNIIFVQLFGYIEYKSESHHLPFKKILICQYVRYLLKELIKKQEDKGIDTDARLALQKFTLPSSLNAQRKGISPSFSRNSVFDHDYPVSHFDEIESSLFDTWISKMNEYRS